MPNSLSPIIPIRNFAAKFFVKEAQEGALETQIIKAIYPIELNDTLVNKIVNKFVTQKETHHPGKC